MGTGICVSRAFIAIFEQDPTMYSTCPVQNMNALCTIMPCVELVLALFYSQSWIYDFL
jgi:hypothetical protein